jgi:hypothetical protein
MNDRTGGGEAKDLKKEEEMERRLEAEIEADDERQWHCIP